MKEKKLYLALGVLVVIGLILTLLLIFRARQLDKAMTSPPPGEGRGRIEE